MWNEIIRKYENGLYCNSLFRKIDNDEPWMASRTPRPGNIDVKAVGQAPLAVDALHVALSGVLASAASLSSVYVTETQE